MRDSGWLATGVCAGLMAAGAASLWAQIAPKTLVADIEVAAVDDFGHPLKNTDVYAFIGEDGKDKVELFQHDRARGVPYGRYRISVQADGGFRESVFDIDVRTSNVHVTAALEPYVKDNPPATAPFRGKIAGRPPRPGALWCKASGLYSRDQYESMVAQPAMSFDFGNVPPGFYVVSCVADRRIVVLRAVKIAADGTPLTIGYSPAQDLDKLQ